MSSCGSFTTIVGMTLLLPFLPIYVEQLGVTGYAAIVQWSGSPLVPKHGELPGRSADAAK